MCFPGGLGIGCLMLRLSSVIRLRIGHCCRLAKSNIQARPGALGVDRGHSAHLAACFWRREIGARGCSRSVRCGRVPRAWSNWLCGQVIGAGTPSVLDSARLPLARLVHTPTPASLHPHKKEAQEEMRCKLGSAVLLSCKVPGRFEPPLTGGSCQEGINQA